MIRAGVIGVGNMGSHHARVYAALTGACALQGVYDPAGPRAAEVAARWDTRAYSTLEELLAEVDVVSVASPSGLHLEHTALALEHGVDVLVEKPLALSLEDARMIERLASLNPREPIVQVGHIEHLNPAVCELRKLIRGDEVVAIDMRRLGPYDERSAGSDVVQDLMLHDIHVLLSVTDSPLAEVRAAGRTLKGHSGADYATATMVFENGVIGTLAASRVTEEKVRQLTVTTTDAHVTVDVMQRTVTISRWTSLRGGDAGAPGYRQESVLERVYVPVEEPLVAQIHSFLRCVRERAVPEVPVGTGVACLEVVDSVRDAIAGAARPAATAALNA